MEHLWNIRVIFLTLLVVFESQVSNAEELQLHTSPHSMSIYIKTANLENRSQPSKSTLTISGAINYTNFDTNEVTIFNVDRELLYRMPTVLAANTHHVIVGEFVPGGIDVNLYQRDEGGMKNLLSSGVSLYLSNGVSLYRSTKSELTTPTLVLAEPERIASAVAKVLLNTEPSDVRVVLDGENVRGATPLEVQLQVGKTYQLKFLKEGYLTKETTLTVDVPGSLEKTVYLTPIRMPEIASTPQTSTKIASQSQLGKKSKTIGTLSVTSNPWAYLYVDDKKIGQTPVLGFSTTTGKHRLKLSNPGMNLKEKKATIYIQENKQMRCSYEFDSDVLQCF